MIEQAKICVIHPTIIHAPDDDVCPVLNIASAVAANIDADMKAGELFAEMLLDFQLECDFDGDFYMRRVVLHFDIKDVQTGCPREQWVFVVVYSGSWN